MGLNIKDASVHEAVKQVVKITGESQAQAVATAVNERLARLQRDISRPGSWLSATRPRAG
jgi:antitoxin VapB